MSLQPLPTSADPKRRSPGIGPVSLTLIVVSVAVALFSNLGNNRAFLYPLFISNYPLAFAPLPEVLHGQVWRLVTPAFIHFGVIHLIFNLLWVKDLGSVIERREGSLPLALLFLGLAVTSGLGQYLVGGPFFGGMSGVVYGWFGYVWLRGLGDRRSGYFMPQQTALLMLVWFVLCLVGVIPNVANTAHGVGLAVGALWGAVSGRVAPLREDWT